MGYPTANPSFTTKNTGDTIQPSHINDLQTEVTAIGTDLRGTLQHDVTTAADKNVTAGGSVISSSLVTAPNQPRCNVFSTAAVPISTAVFTAFTFESQAVNIGGMHSTSANSSRVTVGSSGTYLISARAYKQNGGSTTGNFYLLLNGNNLVAHHYGTSQPGSFQLTTVQRLQATDQITFGVTPNDTALTTFGDGSSAFGPRLEVVRLY